MNKRILKNVSANLKLAFAVLPAVVCIGGFAGAVGGKIGSLITESKINYSTKTNAVDNFNYNYSSNNNSDTTYYFDYEGLIKTNQACDKAVDICLAISYIAGGLYFGMKASKLDERLEHSANKDLDEGLENLII